MVGGLISDTILIVYPRNLGGHHDECPVLKTVEGIEIDE